MQSDSGFEPGFSISNVAKWSKRAKETKLWGNNPTSVGCLKFWVVLHGCIICVGLCTWVSCAYGRQRYYSHCHRYLINETCKRKLCSHAPLCPLITVPISFMLGSVSVIDMKFHIAHMLHFHDFYHFYAYGPSGHVHGTLYFMILYFI